VINGYAWEDGQSKQIVFATADGHIHELYVNVGGAWAHADLTAIAGAPAPLVYWPLDQSVGSALATVAPRWNARGMQIALEHVYLTVTDLDRTLTYYRAFFPDWVIRWEGTSSVGRWVHFGPPGEGQPGYLSLAEDPKAGAIAPYTTAGPQHVGFSHPDVNALIAQVRGTAEPSDTADDGKYRRAYFDDPDGIEIEFVQKL